MHTELTTGNLPMGGLPRNSVARITDSLNMTLAVYRECEPTRIRYFFENI